MLKFSIKYVHVVKSFIWGSKGLSGGAVFCRSSFQDFGRSFLSLTWTNYGQIFFWITSNVPLLSLKISWLYVNHALRNNLWDSIPKKWVCGSEASILAEIKLSTGLLDRFQFFLVSNGIMKREIWNYQFLQTTRPSETARPTWVYAEQSDTL